MELKFCPECGEKLYLKECENEGMIPFCENCKEFRFPVFSVAVSMVVLNPTGDKILLIKQYGNDFYVLTAGYVNKGENAETAVRREIKEELGVGVSYMRFNATEYFEKSQTLLVNFIAVAESENLNTNYEVDSYKWFSFEDAQKNIKENSLAKRFLLRFLNEVKE